MEGGEKVEDKGKGRKRVIPALPLPHFEPCQCLLIHMHLKAAKDYNATPA